MFIGLGLPITTTGVLSAASLLDGSESDGTNTLPGANTFATGWSVIGSTRTNNAVLAPDGATAAATFVEAGATSRHITYAQSTGITGSFTASIYAKQDTQRYLQLLIQHTANGNMVYCYADLQSGTITDSGVVASGTLTSASIAAAVNGYYKISLLGSVGGTADLTYFILALSNRTTQGGGALDNSSPSYASGGLAVSIWRPRLID